MKSFDELHAKTQVILFALQNLNETEDKYLKKLTTVRKQKEEQSNKLSKIKNLYMPVDFKSYVKNLAQLWNVKPQDINIEFIFEEIGCWGMPQKQDIALAYASGSMRSEQPRNLEIVFTSKKANKSTTLEYSLSTYAFKSLQKDNETLLNHLDMEVKKTENVNEHYLAKLKLNDPSKLILYYQMYYLMAIRNNPDYFNQDSQIALINSVSEKAKQANNSQEEK